MADYVTDTGLSLPTLQEVKAEIDAELQAEIDPLLNTEPDGPPGQITAIVLSHQAEVAELAQVAYGAFDPDNAEDAQLDMLLRLAGTERLQPTTAKFAGTRRLTCNLEPGATLPVGSLAAVAGDLSNRWISTEEQTNSGGVAANIPVAFEAETVGLRTANPNTVTVIVTPVPGWNSVTNATVPIQGTELEKDDAARTRREIVLKQAGSGTVDAMRADLLELEYDGEKLVRDCQVTENVNLWPDPVTGIPGKSFEAVVDDGIAAPIPNDVIAQRIWDNKPGGIYAFGNTSGIAIDKTGKQQTIAFTRPAIRHYVVEVAIDVDANLFAGIGETALAVQAFSETLAAGKKVRFSDHIAFLEAQPGILGVTSITLFWKIDLSGPAFTNLVPTLRQRPLIALAADVIVVATLDS